MKRVSEDNAVDNAHETPCVSDCQSDTRYIVRTLVFRPKESNTAIHKWILRPGSLKENQLLVKVKVASISKLDVQIRRTQSTEKSDFNYGVGCEFSGILIDTGDIKLPMIEDLVPGDHVCGLLQCGNLRSAGALASYIIVDLESDIILQTPLVNDPFRSCSWIYSYLYANEFISRIQKITKDTVVFINGGNSDVGLMIVQILRKLLGVRSVIIADSSQRIDNVTKQQASCETIISGEQENLHNRLLESQLRAREMSRKTTSGKKDVLCPHRVELYRAKFDVIIDLVGNDTLLLSSKEYLMSKTNGGIYLRQTGFKGIDQKFFDTDFHTNLWNFDVNFTNVEFPFGKYLSKRELIKMRNFISTGLIRPIVPHKNRFKGLENFFVALARADDSCTVGSTVVVIDHWS